jgi:hypothetical protein
MLLLLAVLPLSRSSPSLDQVSQIAGIRFPPNVQLLQSRFMRHELSGRYWLWVELRVDRDCLDDLADAVSEYPEHRSTTDRMGLTSGGWPAPNWWDPDSVKTFLVVRKEQWPRGPYQVWVIADRGTRDKKARVYLKAIGEGGP